MWFGTKRRNRVFRRSQVLDVKLSAAQRRRTRLRRFVLLTGVLGSVCFGLVAAWRGGEWLLRRLLYENRAFAIHTLNVQTDGVIALEQIRSWAGVRLEDNLLALNLARVKRDLELIPVIRSVAVERVLPHTLRIRVNERQPIAKVSAAPTHGAALAGGVYTLDAEGCFMLPLERHQRSGPALDQSRLPSLVGIPATELRPGRGTELPQVHAALRLVQAFERSPMVGLAELRRIDVTGLNVLRVTTDSGCEVTFGPEHLDQQLRRWRAVHDYGQQIGRQLAWIDLSVSNNVPARWLEEVSPPVAPPRTITPSSYRKHV